MMQPPTVRLALFHLASPFRLQGLQRAARHEGCKSCLVTATAPAPATTALSPRWLSDVKMRIGKCIMFGMKSEETEEAGAILEQISRDWRELVAGSEGFLIAEPWEGLYRQEVVWGDMVVWEPDLRYCCAMNG